MWGKVPIPNEKFNSLVLRPWGEKVDLQAVVINKTGCVLLASPIGPIGIVGDRAELAKLLRQMADRLDPPMVTPAAHRWRGDVTKMSVRDILEYFRSSPDLQWVLSDVEQVLLPLIDENSDVDTVRLALNTNELFDGDTLVWGARAAVARALDIKDAGSYRKRITAVINKLRGEKTTTTPQTAQKAKKSA